MFTYTLWGSDNLIQSSPRELRLVGIRTVAKKPEPHSPMEFANEFIGQELGRAAGLPVVRGERVLRGNEHWFCSFKFNSSSPEQLPSKIDAPAAVAACPDVAAGIVLFDVWICNQDRYDKNLGFDEDVPRIVLFDHGNSLFNNSRPVESLPGKEGKFDFDLHCLVPHISRLDDFVEWFWKIYEIPQDFIRHILREAVELGLPQECVELGLNFLVDRRLRLITMIEGSKHLFKKSLNLHGEFNSLCKFTREFFGETQREADGWLS